MSGAPAFPELLAAIAAAEIDQRAASADLQAIPGIGSGPMGLTPDAVKASPAYRAARARYDAATARLRKLNGLAMRHHGPAMRAHSIAARDARRAAAMASPRP